MNREPVVLSDKLQALLERATDAEQAAVRGGSLPATLTPDAIQDLAAQAVGQVEDLDEQVAALQEELYAVTNSRPPDLMSYDDVRCSVCNAIDADEYADGTARCANCGAILAPPVLDPELLIYPVLVWFWAPCQMCGSGHGEQGGPEDYNCWECGTALVAIKRRACADGFPVESRMGSTRRGGAPSVLVGDQGVWAGGGGARLIGAGPFTLLQVTAIRANGDLDVADVNDGTHWMGLPQRAFMSLC